MSDEKSREQTKALVSENVPSYYANAMALTITPFDVAFTYGIRTGESLVSQARVIMSLEHAMVMLMVARRALREHVKRTGVSISIPPEVMRELQLDEEQPLW
ncbi:MAG: hypothetical protein Q8R92_15415 [Deltaproteobacteria bacterium]|nr:hypothetical protein [Deltaproteobacteria bacterium]